MVDILPRYKSVGQLDVGDRFKWRSNWFTLEYAALEPDQVRVRLVSDAADRFYISYDCTVELAGNVFERPGYAMGYSTGARDIAQDESRGSTEYCRAQTEWETNRVYYRNWLDGYEAAIAVYERPENCTAPL